MYQFIKLFCKQMDMNVKAQIVTPVVIGLAESFYYYTLMICSFDFNMEFNGEL